MPPVVLLVTNLARGGAETQPAADPKRRRAPAETARARAQAFGAGAMLAAHGALFERLAGVKT